MCVCVYTETTATTPVKLAGECRRPEPATKRIHEQVYYHLEVFLLRLVWLDPPQGFAISPVAGQLVTLQVLKPDETSGYRHGEYLFPF